MSSQKLTRELITDWAYGRATVDLAESDCDGDAASFDTSVISVFGAKGLLEFAADPHCPNRSYFVDRFVTLFLWVFRSSGELPFHFSRFLGIKSREDYKFEREVQAEAIYDVCLAVDSMRLIKDPAIQTLYKQLLDFRHAYREATSDFYYKSWVVLDLQLFYGDSES